jgi:Mg-chelatase subunit ChlD
MTTSEFNTMARRVLDRRFFWNKFYDLGGTPLNEALVWAYLNIDKYTKANNIEKMTLITLSDGEGAALASFYGRFEPNVTVYEPTYTRVKQKHFIKDEVTKK